jgi:cytolysin-activating lysine-acyltransferase
MKSMQGAAKTYGDAFGQIVWLLSQSRIHRELKIKDLEWSFMPAVMNQQFRIFRFGPLPGADASKAAPPGLDKKAIEELPLGVAIWGKLSEEAEKKLEKGEHLVAADWNSGDRVWLIELVSPYATAENKLGEAMLLDLVQGPFRETRFFLHRTDAKTGKREKITMDAHLAEMANQNN